MNYSNSIYKISINRTSDGAGGMNEIETGREKVICKVSTKCQPTAQNAYGTYSDNTIFVCSKEPLNSQYYYEYNGIKYTIRYQTQRKQVYYSIMEAVL